MVEETNILSEMCHGRTRDSYSLCGTVARCEQYACGWTEHLSSVSSGTRNDSRKCVSASPPSPHTAAYNRYGYNDRNELTTAYRYLGDDLEDTDDPVPNEHFKYDYDPIGNRRGSWMGPEGEDPIISTDYGAPSGVANSLNQYDRVSSTAGEGTQAISNWIEHDEDGNLSLKWLVGDMNCDGQVNVLDNNAFTLALSDPPAYAAQFPNCQIINADVNNDGYINILDITPYVYLILSGNSGGYTRYVWDAENRLIEVRPAAEEDVLADGITRSEYAYDYLGRRVIKRVYTWDATEDEWNLTLDRRFVYDGWLLLLELDGTVAQPPPAVIRKYTWGLDLAGLNGAVGPVSNRSTDDGRSSAGGIGGLLAMEQASGVQSGYSGGYLFCYDANGNVTQVLDADTGAIAVKYEYDPYGKRVNAPTSGELIQPMTFSTRSFDAETGFGAWLYRLYDPRTGRWTSHDPLGERVDPNLYAFVWPNPVCVIDPLGLQPFDPLDPGAKRPPVGQPDWTIPTEAMEGECVGAPTHVARRRAEEAWRRYQFHLARATDYDKRAARYWRSVYERWANCVASHGSEVSLCHRRMSKAGTDSSTACQIGVANSVGWLWEEAAHSYLNTNPCCESDGYGLQGGEGEGSLPSKESPIFACPYRCDKCHRQNRVLQYGQGAGKQGLFASDDDIVDCIRNAKAKSGYSITSYNCNSWSSQTAHECGLSCPSSR
ncbi:tRNA3(Ser)-specific nuclease WapA precursor [Phycisphaerae bacterium RAS1]|nr:tRNA3(Ser)-specific nuclease WapA precursor [Phycisphaerae bacterium RAS1]